MVHGGRRRSWFRVLERIRGSHCNDSHCSIKAGRLCDDHRQFAIVPSFNFTIPFLLSPPTFIVLCHCLNTLLSLPPCATSVIQLLVQYDLSSLIFLLLFTMLVMYHLLCSSLLFSLLFSLLSLVIYSILEPLFYLQYFPL